MESECTTKLPLLRVRDFGSLANLEPPGTNYNLPMGTTIAPSPRNIQNNLENGPSTVPDPCEIRRKSSVIKLPCNMPRTSPITVHEPGLLRMDSPTNEMIGNQSKSSGIYHMSTLTDHQYYMLADNTNSQSENNILYQEKELFPGHVRTGNPQKNLQNIINQNFKNNCNSINRNMYTNKRKQDNLPIISSVTSYSPLYDKTSDKKSTYDQWEQVMRNQLVSTNPVFKYIRPKKKRKKTKLCNKLFKKCQVSIPRIDESKLQNGRLLDCNLPFLKIEKGFKGSTNSETNVTNSHCLDKNKILDSSDIICSDDEVKLIITKNTNNSISSQVVNVSQSTNNNLTVVKQPINNSTTTNASAKKCITNIVDISASQSKNNSSIVKHIANTTASSSKLKPILPMASASSKTKQIAAEQSEDLFATSHQNVLPTSESSGILTMQPWTDPISSSTLFNPVMTVNVPSISTYQTLPLTANPVMTVNVPSMSTYQTLPLTSHSVMSVNVQSFTSYQTLPLASNSTHMVTHPNTSMGPLVIPQTVSSLKFANNVLTPSMPRINSTHSGLKSDNPTFQHPYINFTNNVAKVPTLNNPPSTISSSISSSQRLYPVPSDVSGKPSQQLKQATLPNFIRLPPMEINASSSSFPNTAVRSKLKILPKPNTNTSIKTGNTYMSNMKSVLLRPNAPYPNNFSSGPRYNNVITNSNPEKNSSKKMIQPTEISTQIKIVNVRHIDSNSPVNINESPEDNIDYSIIVNNNNRSEINASQKESSCLPKNNNVTPPIRQLPLKISRNDNKEQLNNKNLTNLDVLSEHLQSKPELLCAKCNTIVPISYFWVHVQSHELLCKNCIVKQEHPLIKSKTLDDLMNNIRQVSSNLHSSDSETDNLKEIANKISGTAEKISTLHRKSKKRRIFVISSDSE